MDKFTKDPSLMNGKGEDDVEWITVNGSHIPIKDGENPKEAIQRQFGGSENKKDQKTKPSASKEETKKAQQTKSFSEQVDEVLSSKFHSSHVTLCNDTPPVLLDIGVPNKPILMTAKHTYLAINANGKYKGIKDHYHDLGKNLYLKIPKLLENPVMAFQGKHDNDIIVAIDAWDKNKNPVIVPIRINGKGNQNIIEISANVLKSAYGRKNYITYFQKNINNKNLLILDNKKIRSLKD